jgi:hypothetical protein
LLVLNIIIVIIILIIQVMRRITSDSQLTVSRHHDMPRLRAALLRFVIAIIQKIDEHNELGNFFFFRSPNTGPEFEMLNCLLDFFFNGSEEEQDMCRPAILNLLHLSSKDLSDYVCDNTTFVVDLCKRLCSEFSKDQSQLSLSSGGQAPNRVSATFLFFNECVIQSQPRVRQELCSLFESQLLQDLLKSRLFEVNEAIATNATNSAKELLFLTSPELLDTIARFLLHARESDSSDRTVLQVLIQRISPRSSHAVAAATLTLFEVLLALNRTDIFDELITSHIRKGVFAAEAPEVLSARDDGGDISADDLYHFLVGPASGQLPSEAYSPYLVDAQRGISKLMTSEEDETVQTQTIISPNAKPLIKSAVEENVEMCRQLSTPASNGPFLQALLTRVSHMLDQPYQLNIALTGVISRLATSLDPILHIYFLNPHVPVSKGVISLPQILKEILKECQSESESMDDFDYRMDNARDLLSSGSPPQSAIDEDRVVYAVVVAQEMAKELCGIVAAKNVMREIYQNLDSLYSDI